jgi:hypothetical protein
LEIGLDIGAGIGLNLVIGLVWILVLGLVLILVLGLVWFATLLFHVSVSACIGRLYPLHREKKERGKESAVVGGGRGWIGAK